jgi:GNAT superfamily N-acetyltransferase
MKLWSTKHRIPVEVTYLQQREPAPVPPEPRPGVRVQRADRPTVSFYRYLYGEVGRRWQWFERLKLSDEDLHAAVTAAGIEINVLYLHGTPAGFVEFDARSRSDVEIAYFGLLPEFIGQGLGGYFLRWALHRGWQMQPQRVWLHTCSLDHPNALHNYCSAGLEPYRKETVYIDDPRREFPHLGEPVA